MESFRVIMPEFESQRFCLFSISFCSSRKLEFLMLYAKAFFLFGAGSIHLQTNLYFIRHKANTIPMQCRCKRSITFAHRRRKITLNQTKKGTPIKAWVPLSGWWIETRLKRRNLNGLERKRVRLDDFEVCWTCFVSGVCKLVKEDHDRGRTWASGDWSCVGNGLQLRYWHCETEGMWN